MSSADTMNRARALVALAFLAAASTAVAAGLSYPIVDTGQHRIYSDAGQLFNVPAPGDAYYGQDGRYAGNQPHYRDNGDGTVTDRVTGLMWQKNVDYDHPMTYEEAKVAVKKFDLGGHHDWRIPTVKQLYSLIDFRGHMMQGRGAVPFIDTRVFNFQYGQISRGERKIDTQIMSSTLYVGTTMHGSPTQFGVNFGDGRIKGYPLDRRPDGRVVRKYYRFVRGNPDYGKNRFVDNGDGTVSDLATGLMWAKTDSAQPMNWQQALAYCNKFNLAGHHDWRLPNAKELQSIVDYHRAPDATEPAQRGPAIDPIFALSNPQGWEWTGTTHLDGPFIGTRAVYIAFGEATGYMRDRFSGERELFDVHGAGAQRSDPKSGDPNSPRWAQGFGPQGDVIRIDNYVRPVRNIDPNAVQIVTPDTTPIPASETGEHRPPPRRGPRQPFDRWGTPPDRNFGP